MHDGHSLTHPSAITTTFTTTPLPLGQGSWSPSLNLPALLTTIRLLLAHPNAEDGLVPEATEVGPSGSRAKGWAGGWLRVQMMPARTLETCIIHHVPTQPINQPTNRP